jgi:hypothetical protein
LGLNAIAVTAPVCPFRTEIGNPSGKRHYQKQEKKSHMIIKYPKAGRKTKGKNVYIVTNEAYNSNGTVI